MWLRRHVNRTVKREYDARPYRYELTRQGKKRILFLLKRFAQLSSLTGDTDLCVSILKILLRISKHSDPYMKSHEALTMILDVHKHLILT